MRVIAGSAKSIPLKTPKDLSVRPTADRVKEALFSALGSRVVAARVLDAFAGSGALGIEALSRGARDAVFVDSSREAAGLCEQNLEKTRLGMNAHVVCAGILSYLSEKPEPFDLIFIDPPYSGGFYEPVLDAVYTHRALADGGTIVVEYEDKNRPVFPDCFKVVKEKKYGRVFLAFLEAKG